MTTKYMVVMILLSLALNITVCLTTWQVIPLVGESFFQFIFIVSNPWALTFSTLLQLISLFFCRRKNGFQGFV